MAKFRVTEKCFLGNTLREPGDIVEYDGPKKRYLEPLEGEKPGKEKGEKPGKE